MRYIVEEKKNFSYASGMTVQVNPKHPAFRKYGTNIQFATILAENESSLKIKILYLATKEISIDECVVCGRTKDEEIIVKPYYLTAGDIEEIFNYYISYYYPDDIPEAMQDELASLEGEPLFVPIQSFEIKRKPPIPLI